VTSGEDSAAVAEEIEPMLAEEARKRRGGYQQVQLGILLREPTVLRTCRAICNNPPDRARGYNLSVMLDGRLSLSDIQIRDFCLKHHIQSLALVKERRGSSCSTVRCPNTPI